MTCYAALWIPTITYKNLKEIPTEFVKEVNISDEPSDPLYLRVCLNKDNENIDIFVQEQEGYILFVTLKFEQPSCNGLRLYSYERTLYNDNEEGFRFTENTFPEAVYHIIKGFYHIHDFHENESDASLQPFTSQNKINIQKDDNAALMHYLECYEKILCESANAAQSWIHSTRSKYPDLDIQDIQFNVFPNLCLRARGYEVYMGALYRSRYNTKCRPNSTVSDDKTRLYRQRAFNIENALRYINAAEYEFSIKYEHKNNIKLRAAADRNMQETIVNAKKTVTAVGEAANSNMQAISTTAENNIKMSAKSNRTSVRWAIFSIIMGLFASLCSILYSYKLSEQSSDQINIMRDSLNTTIMDVSSFVSKIIKHQQNIEKSLPEYKEILEQKDRQKRIENKLDNLERVLKDLKINLDDISTSQK